MYTVKEIGKQNIFRNKILIKLYFYANNIFLKIIEVEFEMNNILENILFTFKHILCVEV